MNIELIYLNEKILYQGNPYFDGFENVKNIIEKYVDSNQDYVYYDMYTEIEGKIEILFSLNNIDSYMLDIAFGGAWLRHMKTFVLKGRYFNDRAPEATKAAYRLLLL